MSAIIASLKQRWFNRMGHWLDKRIPAQATHTLSLRSVFIFPSYFGLGFLIMCICLFILGTNYQNNLMLFLCNFLIALFLLNLFISYLNFSRLSIKAAPVAPVFAEGHASITLLLEAGNMKDKSGQRSPPSGLLHIGWWREKNTVDVDLDTAQNQCSLPYFPSARGVYPLPRISCYSEYPLGLYRCWTHLDFAQELIVYPAPIPCAVDLVLVSTDEKNNATERPGYDDFDTLHPYQPGEPLHRVAWKNVAKGGDWVSKRFSEQQSATGYLSLDKSAPDVEMELSKLCFQILTLSEQQRIFGLMLGKVKIAPDRGEQHKHACLTALARYPASGTSA